MRTILYLATAFLVLVGFPAFAQDDSARSDMEKNSLVLEMPNGNVTIELLPDLAPHHVERIKTLTRAGFYNGLAWFRVVDGFIAQTGYPLKVDKSKHWGRRGKSDLPDLPDEFSKYKFKRGTVGMGRSNEPDSANSQFFICLSDRNCAKLTEKYTAWGQVTSGMGVVENLPHGEPPRSPAKIRQAYLQK